MKEVRHLGDMREGGASFGVQPCGLRSQPSRNQFGREPLEVVRELRRERFCQVWDLRERGEEVVHALLAVVGRRCFPCSTHVAQCGGCVRGGDRHPFNQVQRGMLLPFLPVLPVLARLRRGTTVAVRHDFVSASGHAHGCTSWVPCAGCCCKHGRQCDTLSGAPWHAHTVSRLYSLLTKRKNSYHTKPRGYTNPRYQLGCHTPYAARNTTTQPWLEGLRQADSVRGVSKVARLAIFTPLLNTYLGHTLFWLLYRV